VIGTENKVILRNWYGGVQYQVEEIQTIEASRYTLTSANVANLVAAMANFTLPLAGQTNLRSALNESDLTTLTAVINANWRSS
jgi:hypothetical protein